jgi:hypothetical protein
MKTWNEIVQKVNTELAQWLVDQSKDPFGRYHWYYRATTQEHIGDLIISKDRPPAEYSQVMPEPVMNQNKIRILEYAKRLPILEYE